MRDTQREAETRQREKQAPCGEPNIGLDPRTPGSQPEPKADTQPLSHPGVPRFFFFNMRTGSKKLMSDSKSKTLKFRAARVAQRHLRSRA